MCTFTGVGDARAALFFFLEDYEAPEALLMRILCYMSCCGTTPRSPQQSVETLYSFLCAGRAHASRCGLSVGVPSALACDSLLTARLTLRFWNCTLLYIMSVTTHARSLAMNRSLTKKHLRGCAIRCIPQDGMGYLAY